LVVSFFGPGVLMRTVSRFTWGAGSPGLGGKVMRTVSFLGIEGLSGLDAEGSSSDINGKRGGFSISPALDTVKHFACSMCCESGYAQVKAICGGSRPETRL
jgi:hypothetical protein